VIGSVRVHCENDQRNDPADRGQHGPHNHDVLDRAQVSQSSRQRGEGIPLCSRKDIAAPAGRHVIGVSSLNVVSFACRTFHRIAPYSEFLEGEAAANRSRFPRSSRFMRPGLGGQIQFIASIALAFHRNSAFPSARATQRTKLPATKTGGNL